MSGDYKLLSEGQAVKSYAWASKEDKPTEKKELPTWYTAQVKWFDPARRFGFLIDDVSGGDVYCHWTVLRESHIRESMMLNGVKVRYLCKPPTIPGKNPIVTRLMIVKD